MEKFYIKIHSFIDLITNSSTEIFMLDTQQTVEVIQQIISEKQREFPPEYEYGGNAYVGVADDWEIKEAFGYIDEEEAINYLKAKGYKIEKGEDLTNYICIKCERGYMNDRLKDFIKSTFNVVYHTTEG